MVSGDAAIIELALNIFRLSQDYPCASALRRGSMSTLGTAEEGSVMPGLNKRLEDLGMEGLMTSFRFLPGTVVQGYCLDFRAGFQNSSWVGVIVGLSIFMIQG